MNSIPGWVKALAVGGVILLLIIIVAGMWVSAHNKEVSLRATIEAKQKDNMNEDEF